MKTTIYRYSSVNTERTVGMHPGYGLYDRTPILDNLEFCDPIEVDLPDGYKTVKCCDGNTRLEDPEGRVCDFIANKDHGFWIMPMIGDASGFGLYVHVDDPEWGGKAFGSYVATVKKS